jgi:signal transduction histidine kinase
MLAAVAVVGVALVVGAGGLVASLHTVLVREVQASAVLHAADAARTLEAGGDPVAAVAGDDDVAVQVVGRSGEVLAATPNAAGRPALVRLAPGQAREVGVAFDDDPFLIVSVAVSDGRTVLVGRTLDAVGASTGAVTALLALGVPLALLVVAATTWWAVGRALAPVEAIRAEVDAISATQLHRRVPLPAAEDEIGRLARTMNRMLDRLSQAQQRQQRFVADASHELRSPIAVVRQHAEVALAHPDQVTVDGLARTAHGESLRMQALVDDLLLLARADEHHLPLRRRPVDLDDLVLAEIRRLRAAASVEIDGSGVSATRIDGDPALLRRLLSNLGDNAVRHARQRIAITLTERPRWADLHIDDDGPGIAAADRSRVFERFVRLDDSRHRYGGGSGLGLAIVTEIVAAHGGSATVGPAPLGGARFSVRLPTAAG